MRFRICMSIFFLATPLLAEEEATTKVTGTIVVPDVVASFSKRVLEIRLYEFDPRIADKAATLVDKLEIQDFAHTTGSETKKDIVLGAKGKLNPMRSYYVTIFVLDGQTRTHIGDCDHAKNNLAKVLTNGQPKQVKVTIRPVN